jgi:antirestriction protein ArdC
MAAASSDLRDRVLSFFSSQVCSSSMSGRARARRTCGATIRHGGSRASYAQVVDYVQMPPFESFRDAESYYSTLVHEMTHWTKHPSRLARDLGRKQWGDEGYAQEELVAELGAASLCADLELATEPRDENASYIANWLERLKSDTRFTFKAAAHAQRATDYLRDQSERDAATEVRAA